MARVTYIAFDGASQTVEVANGDNVMRGAQNNNIEGIVGECGGALACATCHCYVDEAWIDKLPEPVQAERDMLEFAACETPPKQPAGMSDRDS